MKILSNRKYAELMQKISDLTTQERSDVARHYAEGLAAGRADAARSEREQFIAKVREQFLQFDGLEKKTIGDFLKTYDCTTAIPSYYQSPQSVGSLQAILGGIAGSRLSY